MTRGGARQGVYSPPVTASTPRVLVADDDPTIILLLEHVLEGLGWQHDAVEDGMAAWESWKKTRHSLIVLDIDMPGMDGLDVCRRIRDAEPGRETFILVVTGHDRAADLESALAAGADDYVSKPTTGQRLTARLRIAQRRMENDAARRAAEAELSKARWLAGVDEATVSLQHEINNPLAGLLGVAELMQIEAFDHRLEPGHVGPHAACHRPSLNGLDQAGGEAVEQIHSLEDRFRR